MNVPLTVDGNADDTVNWQRGGSGYFTFNGHTDVKELALYVQDQITTGNWTFNVGIRGDLYNGLAIQRRAEPRVGLSYTVKQTDTRPTRLLRPRPQVALQQEPRLLKPGLWQQYPRAACRGR